MIVVAGGLSRGCLTNNYCSGGERIVNLASGVALLVMIAVVIALGWRGKLFGARKA
jgi:hypothetical protein